MRFEAFVAARYLRSKRRNRFVSLITIISVAGVSVGVIALIVVMSVMTGFDIALRDTIIGNRAHLTVEDVMGAVIEDPEKIITEIEASCPEVVASAPFIQVEALLKNKSRRNPQASGAFVVGVDPERETGVTMLADNLTKKGGRRCASGKLPGPKEIVLGYRLANRLNAYIGSQIEVVTDRAAASPWGTRIAQGVVLTVSGISEAKMAEWDEVYGFVDLPTAKMLKGQKGVDAVHFRLDDAFAADKVADRVQKDLGYQATTWYESQAAFFGALAQEKFAMFIILVFIILVAAFNITSTLIMVVMEKRRDIGILRTLGASRQSILLLFIFEGLFIGLSGTITGVVLGTLLAYNLNPVAEFIAGLFGIDLFNVQIYYFDQIPVAVVPRDILWITLSAFVLTLLSTLYPAWSASRLDPVEALRYE